MLKSKSNLSNLSKTIETIIRDNYSSKNNADIPFVNERNSRMEPHKQFAMLKSKLKIPADYAKWLKPINDDNGANNADIFRIENENINEKKKDINYDSRTCGENLSNYENEFVPDSVTLNEIDDEFENELYAADFKVSDERDVTYNSVLVNERKKSNEEVEKTKTDNNENEANSVITENIMQLREYVNRSNFNDSSKTEKTFEIESNKIDDSSSDHKSCCSHLEDGEITDDSINGEKSRKEKNSSFKETLNENNNRTNGYDTNELRKSKVGKSYFDIPETGESRDSADFDYWVPYNYTDYVDDEAVTVSRSQENSSSVTEANSIFRNTDKKIECVKEKHVTAGNDHNCEKLPSKDCNYNADRYSDPEIPFDNNKNCYRIRNNLQRSHAEKKSFTTGTQAAMSNNRHDTYCNEDNDNEENSDEIKTGHSLWKEAYQNNNENSPAIENDVNFITSAVPISTPNSNYSCVRKRKLALRDDDSNFYRLDDRRKELLPKCLNGIDSPFARRKRTSLHENSKQNILRMTDSPSTSSAFCDDTSHSIQKINVMKQLENDDRLIKSNLSWISKIRENNEKLKHALNNLIELNKTIKRIQQEFCKSSTVERRENLVKQMEKNDDHALEK